MSAPARIPAVAYECWFSALEPLYWGDIDFVFEFNGRLDADRLDRAVRGAIADEPIWGYRFCQRWFYPFWRRSTPEELRSLVSVIATDDVGGALFHELSQPVDVAIRLTIICAKEGDQLLIRVDHRLGDATAGRLMIQEIRKRYLANSPEPATDFLAPVVHRTIRLLRNATKPEDRPGLKAEQNRLKQQERGVEVFRIPPVTAGDSFSLPRLLRFGAQSADQLTARAMQDRCTPVMAVLAATHLALRDIATLSASHPHRIYINVDLRRYLPREHQPAPAANMVGDVSVEFPLEAPANFSSALQRVREQLAEQRGPYYGFLGGTHLRDVDGSLDRAAWIPFAMVRWLARLVMSRFKGTPRSVVSDLGSLGSVHEPWGEPSLEDAYCTLGIFQIPAIFVGVSICNGRLTLSIGSGPNSFVSGLVDRIDDHLSRYAGWVPGTARREILQPSAVRFPSPDHYGEGSGSGFVGSNSMSSRATAS